MYFFPETRRSQAIFILVSVAAANIRHIFATAFVRGEHMMKSQQRQYTSPLRSSKNLWSIEDCLEQIENIQFIDASWYHKGERNGRQE